MAISLKLYSPRALPAAFFLLLISALPGISGCWSKPAETKQEQTGEIVLDAWDAAYYLDGSRAGNVHTTVHARNDGEVTFRGQGEACIGEFGHKLCVVLDKFVSVWRKVRGVRHCSILPEQVTFHQYEYLWTSCQPRCP